MKVALDLEEVLVESNRAFVEELQRFVDERHPEAGREFDTSEIRGWKFQGIRDRFAEIRGWDQNIVDRFLWGDGNGWKGFFPVTEELWRTEPSRFPPAVENPGCQLGRMRDSLPEGSEIHLVTGRENVREMIHERLEQLGVLEMLDGVTVEKQKHRLDFDFYVDDHPHLHTRLGKGVQIMVNCPWNRNADVGAPHLRVDDLSEAVDSVESMAFKTRGESGLELQEK